jgi:nitrite reductase/ring-hydroxylating ferredoxin subunit
MAEKIRVSSLDDLAEMIPVCLTHQGVPYCVIKTSQGVKAFIAICPHEGKVMNPPLVNDGCLVCPFHKVAFDAISGEVREARKKRLPGGLSQVRAEILDEVVYLISSEEPRFLAGPGRWQRFKHWLSRFRLCAKPLNEA